MEVSHLVMRGAPIKAVQELLGHASIEMTMRYAHLSPDARRDAVGLLDLASGAGSDVVRSKRGVAIASGWPEGRKPCSDSSDPAAGVRPASAAEPGSDL